MGEQEYLAFSDEAYHTASRFRAVSVVSLPAPRLEEVRRTLASDLSSSEVSEFMWKKLSAAREKFAAKKLIDSVLGFAVSGDLRVDTLIWDTHDSRHDVVGRDDIQNLERMYFHLLRAVLTYRWPQGTKWRLFPDENSAIDWRTMHEFLEMSGSATPSQETLPADGIRAMVSNREYNIRRISEVPSSESPEVQVCDLFAGLGVYSHLNYDTYGAWQVAQSSQLALPIPGQENPPGKFTRSERERCEVVAHLDAKCKASKLQVALASTRGFHSHNPAMPINFWPYVPQHDDDRAPTRD